MRLAIAILIASAIPAYAYQDITKAAVELGSVLGSETACAFKVNDAAVAAYIKTNVDPAEMHFANSLYMMSGGTAGQISLMTPSALAAHCMAIKASAGHYGLIEMQ
ncbi:MAG: hypothetical protein ACEQSU_14060 [Microgenomates group bacterium]